MKQTLSPKSKAIIERFYIHRDRCLSIALELGEDAADLYHLKYKADPGSQDAKQEYERLIESKFN